MMRRSKIVIGIITGEKCDIKYYLRDYLDRAGIEAELDINEITLGMFKITLYSAERMDFIPSAEYFDSLWKDAFEPSCSCSRAFKAAFAFT